MFFKKVIIKSLDHIQFIISSSNIQKNNIDKNKNPTADDIAHKHNFFSQDTASTGTQH